MSPVSGRLLASAVSAVLFISGAGGCARPDRKGVLSEELPLTLEDLAEIRAGEENHEKVLEEYPLYNSPKFETYLNAVVASIAEVSTRPNLPYHVILLDTDEVNIFGGPGGYIYMTRGLMNFVQSESEIAGILAHEIGHISHYEYAGIPQHEKLKKVYNALYKGSELAKDSIGTYGSAMHYTMKGIGKAAPYVARRFSVDAEIHADEKAVEYLLKAGYDPRGYEQFVGRLSQIEMEDVSRFVLLLNTHPPFQDRRAALKERLTAIDFESGKIEVRQDMLSEVRQVTVNTSDSIRFEPQRGVHEAHPLEINEAVRKDEQKLAYGRRRAGWF